MACEHDKDEDCLICIECGECREDLDKDDLCSDCREPEGFGKFSAADLEAGDWKYDRMKEDW